MCCRPQGLSWALKHVRESKQAETTSKALEPQEVAPETTESAPGTHEAASESVSISHQAALGIPKAASEPSKPAATLYINPDEDEGINAFFSDLAEGDRQFWRNYDKKMQEKALRELLQKKSTGFMSVFQVTVNKAAAALHELLLPLTAVHLLNVSFPGAAGTT